MESHHAVHHEFDKQHHNIHAEMEEMKATQEELERDLQEQRKVRVPRAVSFVRAPLSLMQSHAICCSSTP